MAGRSRGGFAVEGRGGSEGEGPRGVVAEDRGSLAARSRGGSAVEGRGGSEGEGPGGLVAECRDGFAAEDRRGSTGEDRHGFAAEDRGGFTARGTWRERSGLALRERLPVWMQARCGLERRSVLALAAVLVLAATFAAQHFWAGRTETVRPPEVVRAVAPYGQQDEMGRAGEARGPGGAGAAEGASAGSAAAASAGASGGAAKAGAAEIVVDVGGKVREPGIHRLPAGSRVADALRAAGGVKPGTDTDGLNRARFLVDGEQVLVGAPGPGTGGAPPVGTAAAAGAAGAGGAANGSAPAAPVSLNTATLDQLDTLPGVGPVLAQHIVDYRTQHGGFRSVDELREVNGIGDRRFADLRALVRP
ncbi:helix-hairpin-helix domain-containing protein [Streptomyces djakartensis]|uniref:helix-hairpin-helix domain-containing protein n=1 Tax=Streptomyces djakartensis TaxID=68193 RepID=UPI0034DEF857